MLGCGVERHAWTTVEKADGLTIRWLDGLEKRLFWLRTDCMCPHPSTVLYKEHLTNYHSASTANINTSEGAKRAGMSTALWTTRAPQRLRYVANRAYNQALHAG